MKLFWGAIAIAALTGCAGNLRLLDGQQAHLGRFESLGKTMEVNINGERYSGTYITNASSGFGTVYSGTSFATINTFNGGSQGMATLTSATGKFIRCEFMYQGMNAQGACQDSLGQRYQLIAGM